MDIDAILVKELKKYVGSITSDASTNPYTPQALAMPLTDCDAITAAVHRVPLWDDNRLTKSSPCIEPAIQS